MAGAARRLGGVVCLVALVSLALALAQSALGAAVSDEEELWSRGKAGAGEGAVSFPYGAASDPVTGHLYVADDNNNRISEFSPWGEFIKAFGWDVAPGPVNEQQEVRIKASTGQFKLSFESQQTASLSFAASSQEVKEALEALGAIPSEAVSVKRVAGLLDGSVPVIYVITFKDPLAATDVAELEATDVDLSGGVPETTIEARTRADGNAATTGLESCTTESGCKAGSEGAGAGQLKDARGVAVDENGNVYVREVGNHRVQKFDSAGRFLLMFGGKVDQTTNANICTKADIEGGDVCGAGAEGSGSGEFGGGKASGIALCPSSFCATGALYVGDDKRIQRFSLGGEWESAVPAPEGKTVHWLVVDPISGDFYVTLGSESGTEEGIHKLDSGTGEEIVTLPGKGGGQGQLAIDSAGDLAAKDGMQVLEFGPDGKPLSPPACCQAPPGFTVGGLATNPAGDLYVASFASATASQLAAFGPGPTSLEAPPQAPPEIKAQFATSVWEDGVRLGARINPRFWADTHYFVQYGTGKCSEGGCEEEVPVPPALLTTKVINKALRTSVDLEGLAPATIYHYRFVAQSGGGGPVFGEGGGEAEESGGETGYREVGEEASFTTPRQLASGLCPNDTLRSGSGARLPDCRAYEMVSPIDKDNGDIKPLVDIAGFRTGLYQSADDGERLTYSSYRSFADPEGGHYTSQYLATRGAGGWSSESIDPPIEADGVITPNGIPMAENPFKLFSADLCQSWLLAAAEPALGPGAIAEYPNLYRREDCGGGGYEALLQEGEAQPSGEVEPLLYYLAEVQGAAADGSAAVFRVQDKLAEGAASGVWQTYYASGGGLRLLCVLPSGAPGGGNCSAGTGSLAALFPDLHRKADVPGAVSEDGNRVYWTASGASESGPGKVYLRLNPGQEQSEMSGGGCTEPEKACTVKVSETATTKAARFLAASPDGSKALFEATEAPLAGNLYEFDLENGKATLIAKKAGPQGGAEPFAGLVGASEDLSFVYLTSEEATPQAEGEGAVTGQPNLYLAHEGSLTYIATLSDLDVTNKEIPSNTSPSPVYKAARVTPDGQTLAFLSTESLTGYDNTDQASEKADSEIYLYRAGSAGPVCVSCNPSGARPQGREVTNPKNNPTKLPAAAVIPSPGFGWQLPRSLSSDGQRLFFDSFDPLIPRDTNGAEDVYEWEAAESEEECVELGAELYVEAAAGCLSLISSGQSPQDSEFVDASEGGSDVFFTTNESLLATDSGLIDIYDARVQGGFLVPPPQVDCLGETCQPSVTPPAVQTPSSSAYEGPEDLKEKPKKKHRKKHKHRHHKKHAEQKRRAGR